MSANSDNNHILFEIENANEKLRHFINDLNSGRLKLLSISDYFEKLFRIDNSNLIDANIPQFINAYYENLSVFDPVCLPSELVNSIISTAKKLKDLTNEYVNKDLIIKELDRIENLADEMNSVLQGEKDIKLNNLSFPVLEETEINKRITIGFLENLTIQIRKAKDQTKFLIIPSELHLEKKIRKQIDDAWLNAIDFLKANKIKLLNKHYEVLIAFNLKEGEIIGNSLGTVLTISIIEELLKFYNAGLVIETKENIAITGGLDETGEIISTSSEIIKIKTEIVFYSGIKVFCVPKINEVDATLKLAELIKLYPKRELEIIGLTNLNDLLNRRNIVDIHRKGLLEILFRYTLKKWKSIFLALILTAILALLFVFDFDDNPYTIASDGQLLLVKNKNGRVLWTLKVNLNIDILVYPELIKNYAKIMDTDYDNANELLFVQTAFDERNVKQSKGTIICFDKYQKIKWEYTFQDTVFSERENLQPLYNAYLIDTTTIENKKVVICYANNATSFSSAIFALDLKTGKRINRTQWNSGFTWDALIVDLEGDGEKELIAAGADNGLKDCVIWGMRIKKIDGCRPTTANYRIKNFNETDILFYIRISKTDYDSLSGARSSGILPGTLTYDYLEDNIRFTSVSTVYPNTGSTVPTFNYSLNVKKMNFDVYLIDQFTYRRDSLITMGKLKEPYTDTKEFKEMIKSRLLYWNDGKWVNRKGINEK